MHNLAASFVLGYHGCERAVGEKLLQNEPFAISENDYDWLGSGVYFWEANPDRALEWAGARKSRGLLFEPFVVGAVIDLGYCLDLISSNGSRAVRTAYERLLPKLSEEQRLDLANSGRGRRKLDCAVVNGLHKTVKAAGLQEFDTVRGLFPEGKELYPGSGFREQTHIQICVRNQDLIHGVFRVADRYFSL